jgi:hypothetical protein
LEINKRTYWKVFIVLALLLLVVLAIVLSSDCGENKNLRLGREYLGKGEFEKALIEFKIAQLEEDHNKELDSLIAYCLEEIDNRRFLGRWERMGDKSEGSIVEIARVGKYFEGKLIRVRGESVKFGFKEQEANWKEIARIAEKTYKGNVLWKKINTGVKGKILKTGYSEFKFVLKGKDGLRLYNLSGIKFKAGNTSTYRKIQ